MMSQQAAHHRLGDLFHAVLQPHRSRRRSQITTTITIQIIMSSGSPSMPLKMPPTSSGGPADELAASHLHKVDEHPAADGGIEHHQQVVAEHGAVSIQVPFGALGLEHVERAGRALLAGAADRELHHHDRQAEDDEEEQVDQHERRAAVLSRDVGEPPDVADPDGAARRNQQEAEPRRKFFPLHKNTSVPAGPCSAGDFRLRGLQIVHKVYHKGFPTKCQLIGG